MLAAILAIAVLAYGPYGTTMSLTNALENEDTAKLPQYVDFPAVKKSLTNDFATRLGLPTKQKSLGETLVSGITGSFMQELVSPDTMVMVLKDARKRDHIGLSANLTDLLMNGKWHGASQFVLYSPDGQPATLLERQVFKWRVTALRIN